jgi:hypothetical protein
MVQTELDPWPICRVRGCGDEIEPGRAALGYTTCPRHWSADPKNAAPPLILQDVNKSNPTVTRRTDFIHEAYADRVVRTEFSQTRRYIHLESQERRTRDD